MLDLHSNWLSGAGRALNQGAVLAHFIYAWYYIGTDVGDNIVSRESLYQVCGGTNTNVLPEYYIPSLSVFDLAVNPASRRHYVHFFSFWLSV